jgi:flagellar P-ring protein precursor FlgI
MNNPAIRVQNIAAIMVTADLDAFEKAGSRLDVTVSSIGDAVSLQGGILLQTAMLGPDGNVYAIAQGALVLGGYAASTTGQSVTVNHPTVGRIPNGATVEREVPSSLPQSVDTMELVLDRADFTNVKRVADALNTSFGAGSLLHPSTAVPSASLFLRTTDSTWSTSSRRWKQSRSIRIQKPRLW